MKKYNDDQIPIIVGKPKNGIYVYNSSENGNGPNIRICIFNDEESIPLTEDLTLKEAKILGETLLKIVTDCKKEIIDEENINVISENEQENDKEKNNMKKIKKLLNKFESMCSKFEGILYDKQ